MVSLLGGVEVEELDCAASDEPAWAASLCGIELLSLFIESLAAASDFEESLLVLCAASLLVVVVVVVELCASAGFAGAVDCAISCGVLLLLSDFGVLLSGVLLGVAVLSGVAVVLLAPLFL